MTNYTMTKGKALLPDSTVTNWDERLRAIGALYVPDSKITYYATLVHNSISRSPKIGPFKTLRGAKAEASKHFGDGFPGSRHMDTG